MAREPFNPDLIRVPPEERPSRPAGPLTVSQVTAMVKQAIEVGLPPTLHVLGEISNFKRHSSGHLYLTLKDHHSELSCVMWRSAATGLKFAPADGMEVVATGAVEVFERAGRYQLYIRKLEPRGVGALELAFRQLCEKLEGEGLFDERHKKPLPLYPSRIVVVTSPTGAAIADILRTIERRYPCVRALVYPVRVQGEGAAAEITTAIRRVNAQVSRLGGVDLMIVGRGGGSLEDLWAFNEEVVARAIHASRIPIVSAVGHEVDVSIADLVADVRAATPTAAAEIAVPVLEEVLADVTAHEMRLARAIRAGAELLAARLSGILQRGVFREPLAMVHRREQILDELSHRTQRILHERLRAHRRELDALEPIIQRIAPHAHLLRTSVRLRDMQHRLRWAMSRRSGAAERAITRCARRLERCSPARAVQHLADKVERLDRLVASSVDHRLSLLAERVRRQEERLAAMSYKSVLGRGFSITRIKKGRQVIRSTRTLKDRQRLVTELADGEFESEVVNLTQLELFE
jgi:exodeoxyribonuclease VII large subunit